MPTTDVLARRAHVWRLAPLLLALFVALLVFGWRLERALSAEPPTSTSQSQNSSAKDEPLDGREGRPLALPNFRPQPRLRVAEHHPQRAEFPVVDVHTHFRIRAPQDLDAFVRLMDDQNIAMCVSLDGRLGDELREHLQYLGKHEDRFAVFANLDFQGDGQADKPETWDCQRPDFARRMVRELEMAHELGASGLKLFKGFGLEYRNPDGSLIQVDDPRFDPIWDACGRLGLVVLMHTADPSAFFEPIDASNERWEELSRHPDWSFYGPQWPSRDELHAARNRIIGRHPKTTFIVAHMGNDAEDLEQLGRWLDEYPNMYADITSRIAELGRQPFTAREFFIKYSDRILFGTDGPRTRDRLLPHWRFFQTRDEYFPYAENDFPPQGFWRIYGIDLPNDVLRKVYHENAMRLIPHVGEKMRKLLAEREEHSSSPKNDAAGSPNPPKE